MNDIVPKRKEKLRACMLCGLIKSHQLFKVNGCENCDEVLRLQGSNKRINSCTSGTFDGFIALMQPEKSWVAKWQRVDKFTKGLYAMRISGLLPEEIIDVLQERGIQYRPRDGTAQD
ncbi:transcription elongation factor spt4 [Lobulomyces angularis]|nr:transcription elongation factor spt4 [Lobulomyces angularis]